MGALNDSVPPRAHCARLCVQTQLINEIVAATGPQPTAHRELTEIKFQLTHLISY
jgi:hypothetical protein